MGITIPLLLHTSLHSRFAYPALDTPADTAGTAVASSSGLATRLSYVTYTTTNVGTIVTSSIATSPVHLHDPDPTRDHPRPSAHPIRHLGYHCCDDQHSRRCCSHCRARSCRSSGSWLCRFFVDEMLLS